MAWLNRREWKSLGVGLVSVLVWGGVAWGQTRPLLELLPSNLTPGALSQGFINFACYDIDGIKFINCTVTTRLGQLDPAFGGHVAHVAPQPLGTIRDVNTPGAGGVSVTGSTLNGFAVVYKAPEASGKVEFVTTWTFPRGYLCLDNLRPTCTDTDHFDVGLQLQKLDPLNDIFYTVIRDNTDTHPDGTSGVANTINKLKVLAVLYYIKTNQVRRLSINDISLSLGGLFDINANWAPPHTSHRRGTGADINRNARDSNGSPLPALNCPDDVALQDAIEWLANGASRPQLVCEQNGIPEPTGPNIHINF